jgi:hypothetical protein
LFLWLGHGAMGLDPHDRRIASARAAYQRDDLLEPRRMVMARWGRFD